jgi:catechol 2,3-dioxygenase-like lactoylglutathione lyase family enzyme
MRAHPRPIIPTALVLLTLAIGWAPVVWTEPVTTQAPARSADRATASPQALARAVDAVGMTVSSIDRSVAFFSTVLTFETVSDIEVTGVEYDRLQGVFGVRMRVVRMRLGGEEIELTEYLTPRGRRVPDDSRSNDRWFQHVAIIVSDMDEAYARLRAHGVEHASPEPQRLPDWNTAAGGITAFYFKNPDGHPLEVLQFPAGKGDHKWHTLARQVPRRIFLGIDHTAIVVGDTSASLAFYRDVLGLRVAGDSTNYGIEQERLNNVFGARLRITGLRAERGPGIEFLEYLSPRNGRPADGIQSNDLAHWETTFATDAADAAFERVRQGRALLVSPAVTTLPERSGLPNTARGRKGFMVHDPDGHAVKVIER